MTLPDRICDPHHHLWERDGPYLVDELAADVATVPEVVRTVFVECGYAYRTTGPDHLRVVGETEWVREHAPPFVEAIVGSGDLRLGPPTVEMLEAHVEAARGHFRGLRQRATWDAHPDIRPPLPYVGDGLLLDPWFRRGFEVLQSMDLSFDVWMYFPQLRDLVDLARAYPEAKLVLNHLGAPITLGPYGDPDRREDVLAAWRRSMSDVASCPNVVLKVGGHGMPMIQDVALRERVRADGWLDVEEVVSAFGGQVRECIELFGPQRCMLESNFPVDRITMSYATLWEAFDVMTQDYSTDERAALFHDTAACTYRLGEAE